METKAATKPCKHRACGNFIRRTCIRSRLLRNFTFAMISLMMGSHLCATAIGAITIANSNFDSDNTADNDANGYGPIDGWTLSGAGIGVNNSSQPFLEQTAHSGTLVAFIQTAGNISQSLAGFDPARTYTVTYFVSERGVAGATNNTSVSLDGGVTIYSQPDSILKTDKFRRIVSGPLTVSGATSTLRISTTNGPGDDSLLIDTVSISRAVPAIPDNGFENPLLSANAHDSLSNLTASLWDSGGAGTARIGRNQCAYFPAASFSDEGSQALILIGTSDVYQDIAGFEAGVTYTLSFRANGRTSTLGPNVIQVKLGGAVLTFTGNSSVTPTQGSWTTYTTDAFTTGGGTLALRLIGLTSGDKTTFLDDLRFNFVAEAPLTITNLAESAVTDSSATFSAQLVAPNDAVDVYVQWWPENGSTNAALVGGWANVASTNISFSTNGLSGSTTYHYRFQATNSYTNVWATPNRSFTTMTVATMPSATVGGGATGSGVGTATLRGNLAAGVFANAYICWGPSDGGTVNTGNWQNVIFHGVVYESEVFTSAISGLFYGLDYQYRVFVTNDAGGAWSSVTNFSSLLPAWSPSYITTLAWYDASDTGSIAHASGAVSQWRDKSGNNNHLTQGTPASRPTTETRTVHGLNVIDFDGSSEFMTNALSIDLKNRQVIFVVQKDAAGADMFFSESEKNTQFTTDAASPARLRYAAAPSPYWTSERLSTATFPMFQPAILAFIGTSDIGYSINGSYVSVAGNAGGTQSIISMMGKRGDGSFDHFDGVFAEVVFLPTTNADDRKKVEGYMAWKWGLEGSLPNDHTYKYFSPPHLTLAPAISNSSATNITGVRALLRGTLDSTGGVFTVMAYWSTTSNANANAWLSDDTKGSALAGTYTNVVGQALSVTATGLRGDTDYYYTFAASNVVTTIWATPNEPFKSGRPLASVFRFR